MDTIKIITTENIQEVEITPATIVPPKRRMPIDIYAKQLTLRRSVLQKQLEDINAQLKQIKDIGIKTEQ